MAMRKRWTCQAYNNISSDWNPLRYFWTPGYGDGVNSCENGEKITCVSMVYNRATVTVDEM